MKRADATTGASVVWTRSKHTASYDAIVLDDRPWKKITSGFPRGLRRTATGPGVAIAYRVGGDQWVPNVVPLGQLMSLDAAAEQAAARQESQRQIDAARQAEADRRSILVERLTNAGIEQPSVGRSQWGGISVDASTVEALLDLLESR